MNAKDREDVERFARNLAGAEVTARPASPARPAAVRVVTVTPPEPLEHT